jgi:hypothetical protein
MTAALLFQLVSLVASVAMVPLLLGFLGAQEYLLWAVFTTIGGLTLQLEAAIQTLMVRRVAPRFAAADTAGLRLEELRGRRAFRRLSLFIFVVVIPFGWLYLQHVAAGTGNSVAWQWAWVAFGFAYGLNYLFGPNNVLLMGTARTDIFYRIGTVSRILNIGLCFAALAAGFGLLGVSAAFLLSVVANVLSISFAASRVRRGASDGREPGVSAAPAPAGRASAIQEEAGLGRYTLFTLAAYLLYRGAFLLVVGSLDASDAAAYGLALQAFAILGSIAIIPLHVRLHLLAKCLHEGNSRTETVELVRAVGFAVFAMLGGLAAVALVGPPVLALISSDVQLPAIPLLALMAAAFLVEALILVFANLLILRRDLGFVRPYVLLVLLGLGAGALLLLADMPVGIAMLVVPLLVQAAISLPLILARLAAQRGEGTVGLLKTMVRAAPAAARRA